MVEKRDQRDINIEIANETLKGEGIGISIERRGGKLCLRGTLPDRNSVAGRKQKRIPLGLPATETGVEIAASKARETWEEVCKQEDAAALSLHDAVRDSQCIETEVVVEDQRFDGIDASGVIVEVKSTSATARDVGQIFGYMEKKCQRFGRLIAPSFGSDALALIEAVNSSGKYEIKAQRICLEDVA